MQVRTCYFICIVITVRFSSATYNVDENDGILRPVLLLNHSSPFVETVYVMTTDISAEGRVLFNTLVQKFLNESIFMIYKHFSFIVIMTGLSLTIIV